MDSSSTKVNPDLAKERAKASFNVLELTYLLYGGQQKAERKRYLESLLTSDPVFSKEDVYVLDREKAYERALQKGLQLVKLRKKHNITDLEDIKILRRVLGSRLPYDLSYIMFIPSIKSQGTKEQREKWLPLSETYQIIGTYAQTEMGHVFDITLHDDSSPLVGLVDYLYRPIEDLELTSGTYVRGLETTATYDKDTQEFVIHSPSLSACKWWPGFLGKTCTHAVIAARLIVNGSDHGIQLFIVQLRDLHSHQPLPGIQIGDIGPKFSMYSAANDNGFLMFDHVRIPRDQMLMGLVKLSPDGVLSKPPHTKAVYGTMSFVRAVMVAGSFEELSKAITIAVRYSAVRRQSELRPGEPEAQIIDYKTQQYKLLPGLASAYALQFTYDHVWRVFQEMQSKIGSGDYSMLPEVHALTSGLKAFSTSLAMRHAETCRLACGGHGYLLYSGLPDLYARINASCTYEGDNDVLYLQVARYLMKCASKVRNGVELSPSLAFLSKTRDHCPATSPREFLDPCVQRMMYQHKTASEIMTTVNKIEEKIQTGLDPADAWNEQSVDLLRCAKGYSNYVVVVFVLKSMEKLSGISHKLRLVLKALADLFVLWSVVENSGSFLETGALDSNQIRAIREQVYSLMEQLRPETVSLVDAFDYSDYELNSALGRHDGNVYEELFRCAQRSALNKQQVLPSYYKYLRPLMQSHKAKL